MVRRVVLFCAWKDDKDMRRVDLYHVYWQWDTYTHLNGGGRGGKGSSEEGGRVNGIHKASSSVDRQPA